MKIKYVGHMPDGMLVDHETRASYPFKKGIPIEVPDGFGEHLLARHVKIWKKAAEEKTHEGGGK